MIPLLLTSGTGLVVVRLLSGRLTRNSELAAFLVVPFSDVGMFAAGTLPRIARERGVA